MSGSPKTTNRLPEPVFFNSPAMCRSGFMRAFRIGMRPIRSNSAEWASKLKAQAITTSNRASAASRAASTRSARATVPNSGPRKIAARRSRVAFEVAAFGADQIARPWRQRREGDAVLLVRLLHARRSSGFRAPSARNRSSRRRARRGRCVSIRLSSSSTASTRCGDRLSTVNGPATRMRELSG